METAGILMLAICHTSYSLQAGVRGPAEWARAAADRGYRGLALADVNGLYGAVHFYRAVEAAGLVPLIGALVLGGCTAGAGVVALARSARGYRQLCALLTRVHLEAGFRLESLGAASMSDLFFLSRSPGALGRLAAAGAARDALFLLPAAPGHPERESLWDFPAGPAVSLAPVPDSWFIDGEDGRVFSWLAELRRRKGQALPRFPRHPGALLPEAEAWRKAWPGAEEFSERLLGACGFRFQFGTVHFPRISLPRGETAAARLERLCRAALPAKYGGSARRSAAESRLRHELAAIIGGGFADYFLFVHEITEFARAAGIPVEVRGSAASSIVSYLLGFTHCCPIAHDLCFERFLNPGRRDLPDIDIDIADRRRDEVVAFCYRRWGRERVAMLATVAVYRSRTALRDAARLFGIPQARVTAFLNGDGPLPRAGEVAAAAERLRGLPRHLGLHSGGLVITPDALTRHAPLTRAPKGVVMLHYEKDQAEALGLVKMDLLGNSALTVIDQARALLRARGVAFREPGPAFDYKVRRLFAAGDTLGVYQCESPGMRQLCRAVAPRDRREAAVALSLIRPGPAAGGMKEAFIRRRRGLEPVRYVHPGMEAFLADTYGVMLYQEDVMTLAMQLAGYSAAEADTLRRAVAGKVSAGELAEERRRFFARHSSMDGPDSGAAALWAELNRFAAYAFCKAHAAVYGRLAWLTARLKAHWPREFYTAVLNSHKSMYPKRVFVWDALRRGIPVRGPDLRSSHWEWRAGADGIRAGLGIIRGLRERLVREILAERGRRPFSGFDDLRRRVRFHAGELERLILVGACAAWGSREELWARLRAGKNAGEVALWPVSGLGRERLPPQAEAELALTGIPFTAHPAPPERGPGACAAVEMAGCVGREVRMVGILDAFKHTRAAAGADGAGERFMSFATLEDASGLFEVVLFPEAHARWAGVFRGLGPYRLRGRVTRCWDSPVLELLEAAPAGRAFGCGTAPPGLFSGKTEVC